ncbi:MAG TPA: hypothetical protein ENN18_01625 [Proteobacteria bacterium]|nr:hypothetical protein [Pseudomonadota bacterium]
MLLKSIHIEGFGPYHEAQTVQFGAEQIIGIYGPNGSGKTFLLEAALACLYESFPSRKGTIYSHLGSPKGTIEVSFELDGQGYRAMRTVQSKPQKQEAHLYCDNQLIAGPKTTEFAAEIEKLLGPAGSALACIFSAQDSAGDMINLSPSERKELLASWLGLEACSRLAQGAADKSKHHNMRLEDIDAHIKAMEKEELRMPEYVAALKEKEEQLKENAQTTCETNKQLQALYQEKAGIEEAVRRIKELRSRLEALSREREELKNSYTRTSNRLEELEKIIRQKAEIESKARKHTEIVQEITATSDVMQKLQKEYQAYQGTKSRLEEKIHATTKNIAVLKSRLDSCRKQASTIQEVHCSRRDCKFLTEAWKAKDAITIISQKLTEEEQRLAHETLQLKNLGQPPAIEPVLSKMKQMQTAAKELEAYVRLAAQLEAAEKNKQHLAEELDRFIIKGREKAAEIEKISASLKEHAKVTETSALIEKQVSLLEERSRKLSAASLAMSQELGEIKARIQATLKIQQEIAMQKERRGKITTEISEYEAIARIYGKNGVQPLIIDAATPELEALTRQFLTSICQKNFDVSFMTQRETNKGKALRETLDIIITDLATGQKRDIANFSGGEKVLLSQAIRMAMSVFQAQKSRKPWQTFFLDESLGELDEVNAENFLRAVADLTTWFRRILYISHTPNLTLQAQKQVKVENGTLSHTAALN